MRVVVVGAGVIGLSTALRLLEAGHRVSMVAEARPEATTSSVAAAVWYPYLAEPRDRVLTWSARTAEQLAVLARRGRGGVRMMPCVEVVPPGTDDPWFRGPVLDFRRAGPAELPAGHRDGWRLTVPVIDMRRYLPWLASEVCRAGADLELRRLADLGEAIVGADAVVHCAGLGARDLAGDRTVVPVRGQIVVISNPGLDRVLLDESGPTYVVPRGDECVLGGTADAGRWDTEADPAAAAAIVRRCAELEPRVAGARVLAHRVGLRPVRPTVRLELDAIDDTPVLHHYGHGGAGVTLSWGCAEEAVMLLAQAG